MHPSIVPSVREEPCFRSNDTKSSVVGSSCTNGDVRGTTKFGHTGSGKAGATAKQSRGQEANFSRPALATINDGTPKDTGTKEVQTACSPDTRPGDRISKMPLEVGRAAQFGDQTVARNEKCQVFEVVLQQQENTICPSCARSPRRAALPAHARGCFGLS